VRIHPPAVDPYAELPEAATVLWWKIVGESYEQDV
jgi:hypothetical protein